MSVDAEVCPGCGAKFTGTGTAKCSNCGTLMDGDAVQCPGCHAKFVGEGSAKCGNCNSVIPLNTIICPNCEVKLEPEQFESSSSSGTSSDVDESRGGSSEGIHTAVEYERLGNDAFRRGNPEDALRYYELALKLDPNYIRAWNNRGVVLRAMNRIKDALECYDRALKLNSEYKNAWFNKGYALEKLDKLESAIECYNRAIEIEPTYEDAIYYREQCLKKLKKKNKQAWKRLK